MTDYTKDGTYQCTVCRDEPMPHPGMTCAACKAMRKPNPAGAAPWDLPIKGNV